METLWPHDPNFGEQGTMENLSKKVSIFALVTSAIRECFDCCGRSEWC